MQDVQAGRNVQANGNVYAGQDVTILNSPLNQFGVGNISLAGSAQAGQVVEMTQRDINKLGRVSYVAFVNKPSCPPGLTPYITAVPVTVKNGSLASTLGAFSVRAEDVGTQWKVLLESTDQSGNVQQSVPGNRAMVYMGCR